MEKEEEKIAAVIVLVSWCLDVADGVRGGSWSLLGDWRLGKGRSEAEAAMSSPAHDRSCQCERRRRPSGQLPLVAVLEPPAVACAVLVSHSLHGLISVPGTAPRDTEYARRMLVSRESYE